jgi:hypothetical protein
MKIKDEDLIRIHLKARELAERALVCGYTSPSSQTYEDRLARVEEALADLLKVTEKADV